MAKWGNFDYNQWKRLQQKLEKLNTVNYEACCKECAKELAARLLAKVIKRTPVGDYPKSSGKKGGTLRRGWTAKTEEDAKSVSKNNAKQWANTLTITKTGDTYKVEIINPVRYASYVEYGHRTRDHKEWVRGRFMLTISEQEVETIAPKLLEQKLLKYLGECFDD